MKTIWWGYKALSIVIGSLVIAQTASAGVGCQTYTMISSSNSPSRVIKVNCDAKPTYRKHTQKYTHVRKTRVIKEVVYAAENNCPCGAVYTGCQCYPDPWYQFERQNSSCYHKYIPGHWVGTQYQEYYVEPNTMNPPSTPYDPDVAYNPNDDICVNRF